MSPAALALALALLIAPGPRRRCTSAPRQRRLTFRIPLALWLVAIVVALLVVAPVGVVVAAVIAAATVQARSRRRRADRVRAKEAAALEGALDVLVGELRIGAHPVTAFDTAADEADGAVSTALRTVSARARMGGDVAAGMASVARRSALPTYWRRLAVCWDLAQSHGLAIAALMHTAHRDVVARERFSAQLSAGMAGARTTATVLAALPLLGVALGELVGAHPLRFLFSTGQWLLVIGAALTCLGLAWSDRITGGVTR
ncbi:type II secretion system F family protein [Mycolicibacterium novocastrense]|uniref:Type II secretion system F family protein n=1 Tax=Mycolicibacterium novocastrense TaxID=59813 RepID=A0AAW5SLG3_MYCNV|nr:type II secretion system F family protein [Mycolicibacterium novocastrense]MCV7024467.1 type II secretion system F family protein [Mycolicibacterium novocastrense]GAT11538.1 type II secretion system protein [Mycolicibacterium novocastrense]